MSMYEALQTQPQNLIASILNPKHLTGSLLFEMAGWACKAGCGNRTHRRPPGNICFACRSCRRGRHNQLPQRRFTGKRRITSQGLPAKQDNKIKRNKTPYAEDPPAPMAMTAAGAETKPRREPLAAEAATSTNFQQVLENRFGKVKDLVGPWKAYIIMGTALRMLDRIQKSGQKPTRAWVPGAFLSVAAAISAVPDADEIR